MVAWVAVFTAFVKALEAVFTALVTVFCIEVMPLLMAFDALVTSEFPSAPISNARLRCGVPN
jgi:hypothetical protein